MDKIKKNAFWAGVAGALILLVILAMTLIPKELLAKSKLTGQIKGNTKALNEQVIRSPESTRKWVDRKQQMLASYKKITDFYAASDRHFERWFDGFDGRDRGTFMARYREEIQKLEDGLTGRSTEIGIPDANNPAVKKFGFNWEEPLPQQWDEIIRGGAGEEARVLKELQKRFWVRQRVANAIQKADVKVTRVHDFRFFRRLAPNLRDAAWDAPLSGADAVVYPGARAEARSNFTEFDFPNELGKTYTFGFALLLPYSEVPKILKEIVNPDIEPRNDTGSDRLLVNLIGAQVTLRDQNRPAIDYWHWEGDDAHKQAQRAKALQEAGMTAEAQARDILLAVSCQIVDFEPTKVKKLELDPPADAAAPKP
jgi:hypothetical protein